MILRRSWSLSLFARACRTRGLAEANVTPARLAALEGNPGIFQTPPRHARALKSLASEDGRRKLRLIIGLRDPFDLSFSLWSFLSAIGQEGKRVELRMARALAAIDACNDTLYMSPVRLLGLTAHELEVYRSCLDDRPRSKQHFYVYVRRAVRLAPARLAAPGLRRRAIPFCAHDLAATAAGTGAGAAAGARAIP